MCVGRLIALLLMSLAMASSALAQHEGHHFLDRGRVVGPGELRHPQPVVPRLVLLALLQVVVTARAVELLVEETHPRLVRDLFLVELVGAVARFVYIYSRGVIPRRQQLL